MQQLKINFEKLLQSILKPYPLHKALREYVNVCHKIAITYLKLKVKKNQLNLSFFDLPIEDLAIDLIAPLFKIDDNGYLCDVKRFYENHNYSLNLDSDEYLILTRQLIFGTVKQNLFRLYGEYDHELSKIVRNIKLELNKHPFLCSKVINGQIYLTFRNGNGSNHLSDFPLEIFESELIHRLKNNFNIPQIVGMIYTILKENSKNKAAISLTSAAIAVRNCVANADFTYCTSETTPFTNDEKGLFLSETLNKIKEEQGYKYIAGNKLTVLEVEQMFAAAGDIIRNMYINDEIEDYTNFDTMRRHIPDLTLAAYTDKFRTKFEYISKLAREDFLSRLKNEL